jgi:hypothetical protein
LLPECGRQERVYDVAGDEVYDVLPFVHGLGNALLGEVGVETLQLFDNGGSAAGFGRLEQSLHAVEVQVAVGFAEAGGQLAHGGLGEQALLQRYIYVGPSAAIGEQRKSGHDVVDSVVRVGAL